MWWPADNVAICPDCASRCHDATRQRGRNTLLVCNYCGLGVWVFNAPPPPGEQAERMKTGRFAGMTFAEIEKQPNGRRYIEYLKENDSELSEAVSRYLAASQ